MEEVVDTKRSGEMLSHEPGSPSEICHFSIVSKFLPGLYDRIYRALVYDYLVIFFTG